MVLGISSITFAQSTQKATTTAKRMAIQVIDQSYNPVAHRRVIVFETLSATDILNLAKVNEYFQKVKGFQSMMPNASEVPNSRRVVLVFDDTVDLLTSPELEKVMAENNWVLVNYKR
jgi:Zn-dependent protease with chaperone function